MWTGFCWGKRKQAEFLRDNSCGVFVFLLPSGAFSVWKNVLDYEEGGGRGPCGSARVGPDVSQGTSSPAAGGPRSSPTPALQPRGGSLGSTEVGVFVPDLGTRRRCSGVDGAPWGPVRGQSCSRNKIRWFPVGILTLPPTNSGTPGHLFNSSVLDFLRLQATAVTTTLM